MFNFEAMENFVVSSRKYRPQTFDSVVGQQHITSTLKNAIVSGQLAQAFLFCGPRGVGKTTCARILAKVINMPEPEKAVLDDSYAEINSELSLNIFELDAASNNSVDDIRNLVEQVRFAPQAGKYKIYIIDEVHMLSTAAFNAFLKTLEEPPPYAIFILATTEKHKILPTILSRCQIFNFNRIQVKDIALHLEEICKKEKVEFEPEALHIIAQKADGALRDALSILDQMVSFSQGKLHLEAVIENLNIIDFEYYFKLTDLLLAENLSETLLLFDEVIQKGFEGIHFILGLAEHLRNLLMAQDSKTIKLLNTSENLQKKYLEQSKNATGSFLLSALNIANQCEINYKASKNQQLHVELALMKMAHLQAVFNLEKKNISSDQLAVSSKQLAVNSELQEPKPNLEKSSTSKTKNPKPPNPKPQEQNPKPQNPKPKPQEQKTQFPISQNPNKLGSLKKIQEQVAQNQKSTQSNKIVSKEEGDKLILNEVAENELNKVWNDFLKISEIDYPFLFAILERQKPKIKPDCSILIEVSNKVEKEKLENQKEKLLNYLRKELKNEALHIKSKTVKIKQNKGNQLYTSKDKFQYLAKKNPVLEKLQKEFQLDVDF